MSVVVELRDVSRRYSLQSEIVAAVVDVDLSIGAGEVVGLVGPSGSGKTTLLNLVIGWEVPDTGTVLRDPSVTGDWTGLAVIPQAIGLLEELSVIENIELASRLGNPQVESTESVLGGLDLAGLGGRRVDELSMGEKQRVSVARALAYAPRLLVADEPTAHLDEPRALLVGRRLIGLAGAGSSVLITTHDGRILDGCDRIIKIRDGRLESEPPSLDRRH
jgi:ABC-type lipoprotein export system ATPase subunit